MAVITGRRGWTRRTKVFRGSDEDIRAMKRALANAPLGPTAVLALSSAIIALEEDRPPQQEAQPKTPPAAP